MAKPMDPLRAAMLLTPTTWPAMFTSGPPELPGLIAASVWMKSKPGAATVSGAPLRLTIPNDTLCSSPKGWPSASTNSPTRRRLESPRGSTTRPLTPSTRTSARSTRLADHLAVHAAAVGQPHLQPLGAFDDMGIGHDEPAGIDYEADPLVRRGSPGVSCPSRFSFARRTRM